MCASSDCQSTYPRPQSLFMLFFHVKALFITGYLLRCDSLLCIVIVLENGMIVSRTIRGNDVFPLLPSRQDYTYVCVHLKITQPT